jgi:hypothetical protein
MWVVVFLLVGFWGLGFAKGYSFGGLIHVLLVYAALMATARLLERRRRRTEQSPPPKEPFVPLNPLRD